MAEENKFIKFSLHDAEYETLPLNKYIRRPAWKAPNLKHLTSGIPGTVLEVLVKPGSKVKSGETVLLLEAMKMNNMLSFTINGVIKKIHVKKGDVVPKNHLLAELK
jgi:biotin carboxyl carrier protein